MKSILFVVLCVLILSGCGDKAISPSSAVETYEYYPLQVGNIWRYQVLNGNIIRDTLDVSINATQIYNGKTYFVMVTSTKNGKYSSEYCRVENDKLYKFQDNKEKLYIDFGKKDTTVGFVYETIDGVQSLVGTFDKVKNVTWIAAAWDGAPYANWYAPKVGLIYSGFFYDDTKLVYAKIGDKIYK